MRVFIKYVWKNILDVLFPHLCVGCQKMDTLLCKKCLEKITYFAFNEQLEINNNALDSISVMSHYDTVIKSAIQQLKYHSIKELGTLLGTMLYETTPFPIPDLITSVPLHPSRQRERGFNQAEIIAKSLSKEMHIPYQTLLQRNKKTVAQAKTSSKEERLTQLSNIFSLSSPTLDTQGKTVLLIDDVITTGATLNECAIVLKHSGCKAVHGLTVAHGT
jgi:competence protein ComFC